MALDRIYRTFNGKRYRAESWENTKREALQRASKLHKKGYLARVIKEKDGRWYVWYF